MYDWATAAVAGDNIVALRAIRAGNIFIQTRRSVRQCNKQPETELSSAMIRILCAFRNFAAILISKFINICHKSIDFRIQQ